MFLRATTRKKDGKTHRYWSVVENRRLADGRVLQRHVLYLGEINDQQAHAWRRSIEVMDDSGAPQTLSLFAEHGAAALDDASVVRLRLSQLRLCRPRQWGAVWLAWRLWQQLQLDTFWSTCLGQSRKHTRWEQVLFVLVAYRLVAPGSEWKLHRHWYEQTALGDLLGADVRVAEIHKLYVCHDRLLEHKRALFDHLTQRWRDLFNVQFDVLLYDLTSTYFESHPPFVEGDKRRYGHSRDHRSDCVQVVIALIVTPEGLPLAYEVLPGNTADSTTLRGFLQRIEHQYGKARRTWVMDRGIPTEAVLAEMRSSDPPVQYLVGTPKGRLHKLEQDLISKPWHEARAGVHVKLIVNAGETYVYAQSIDRVAKERSMRTLKLRRLSLRLKQLSAMTLKSKELLMKLGAARGEYPAAWRLFDIVIDEKNARFNYTLNRARLRIVRRREGRYLLRTNLTDTDPAQLWSHYLQLVQVEEAFKNLKNDLAIRPIYHQHESRIEAHIFIAFLAYSLHVTLARQLHAHASGLTARTALEKFATMQMIDVHIPTTDGREIQLTRYTQPERDLQLLLAKLHLELPDQPPPRITGEQSRSARGL